MTKTITEQAFYLQKQAGIRPFFHDPEDYRQYFRLLMQSKAVFDIQLRAFCLLPKEIHLIVVPSDSKRLNEFMLALDQLYTMYDRSLGRGGARWGNMHVMNIDDEQDLARFIQDMEFLPVNNAGALSPAHYPWSSYLYRIQGTGKDVLDLPSGETKNRVFRGGRPAAVF